MQNILISPKEGAEMIRKGICPNCGIYQAGDGDKRSLSKFGHCFSCEFFVAKVEVNNCPHNNCRGFECLDCNLDFY